MLRRRVYREDRFGETPASTAPAAYAPSTTSWVASMVYAVVGVIEALLGLRFVFLLFGANSANGFVDFIYSVTHPLVQPFTGIFGNFNTATSAGVLHFDLATLIAMAVYGIIGWAIVRFLTPGVVDYS